MNLDEFVKQVLVAKKNQDEAFDRISNTIRKLEGMLQDTVNFDFNFIVDYFDEGDSMLKIAYKEDSSGKRNLYHQILKADYDQDYMVRSYSLVYESKLISCKIEERKQFCDYLAKMKEIKINLD